MNIGFVNIYPYRPHGHHAKFLEIQAKKLGWKSFSLSCDAAVPHCYLRELKGSGKLECAKCMVGGLNSFAFDKGDSVRDYFDKNDKANKLYPEHRVFVESSALTLTRIESYEQRSSEAVEEKIRRLSPGASQFYFAAKRWIKHRQLDAVIVFNGRMDLPRAVIEACKDSGVTFLTHERPLFGNGIILNKNSNCSSLEKIHGINQAYSEKALNREQALMAAELGLQRLSTGNIYEWKRYNPNSVNALSWPLTNNTVKVLVCPSSKNELLGHPDWETEWHDNTDALDLAVEKGLFDYSDLVVRFHPSWAVDFGRVSGDLCASHYRQWCEKRGVFFFDSTDTVDTLSLIQMSDVVVVNGSTVVMEAGLLGKPILCFGPSSYTFSGVTYDVLSVADIGLVDMEHILSAEPENIIRKTLRIYYSRAVREPVFVDNIRSTLVTECEFYDGANSNILYQAMFGEEPVINDDSFSDSEQFEDKIISLYFSDKPGQNVSDSDFSLDSTLLNGVDSPRGEQKKLTVTRKHIYIMLDKLRRLAPKGV